MHDQTVMGTISPYLYSVFKDVRQPNKTDEMLIVVESPI